MSFAQIYFWDGGLLLANGAWARLGVGSVNPNETIEVYVKWSWFFGHKKGLFLDRGRR